MGSESRGVRVQGRVSGVRAGAEGLLFLRCFFLVLRHTPGTPGTGLTSLLLTGGGCRMGLGARVRHTGRPAAHSRIPVIPGGAMGAVRGRGAARPRPPSAPVLGIPPGPTHLLREECLPRAPPTPVSGANWPRPAARQGADRWGCLLVGPALLPFSPARAGCTGPVPFRFFTGSAGTLRGGKRQQLDFSLPPSPEAQTTLVWLPAPGHTWTFCHLE